MFTCMYVIDIFIIKAVLEEFIKAFKNNRFHLAVHRDL